MKVLILIVSLFFIISTPLYAAVSSWQKSASFVPMSQGDFGSSSFQQSVKDFAATGGNFVTLIIPIYQPNEYSTTIRAGWNTPTDDALKSATQFAHSLGLKVTYKIHIENEDGRWRAYINPSDRTTWFKNYGTFLVKYALMGQSLGVEQFIIGAELYNMTSSKTNSTNTINWENLINQVRSVFSGLVTYSAQRSSDWYSEFNEIEFWDSLDSLGLSAYYPMAPQVNNPTVNDYINSWQAASDQYILPMYQQYQKPVLLTEIGYRSINEANKEPFSYDYAGAPNMQIQADLFEALFSFWNNQAWMSGIHLWDWLTNPNAGGPNDQGYTPQNKLAENVITEWFTQGGSSEPTPSPSPSPTQSPAPQSSITATISPQSPIATDMVNISVHVGLPQTVSDAIVDVEIYSSSGQLIHQTYFEHQNLSSTPQSYPLNRKFPAGSYRIAVGVFRSGWSSLITWQNEVKVFSVSSGTTTPTPTPSPSPSPTPSPTSTPSNGELLPSSWNFTTPSGGSAEKFQKVSGAILQGKTSLVLTYNLNGACILPGDASAIVFDQGGWRFVSLANYGKNCHSGEQTVTIPLSEFPGLNTAQAVSTFQARFWLPSGYSITIASATLSTHSPQPTPTPSPTTSPTPSPTPTPSPSTTPTPSAGEIEVWWPTNGSTLSGLQPFKAIVAGLSLNQYKLYWQVDGGTLNEMQDSNEGAPHKESLVDVSPWNWRGNGPYALTFVAKDLSGTTLKEKSISITISR